MEREVVAKIKSYMDFANKVASILRNERDLLITFGLDPSYPEELDTLREKLEFYYHKLSNNIVEIAFVGLEKSGKSTVINAIIEKNFLPAEKRRTTYTVTTVKYGHNLFAEIEFYTKDEFVKDIFRNMLKAIEFPNFSEQTLDTVTTFDIEQHFELLKKNKPDLYELHYNTTGKDLLEILEGKDVILEHLSRSSIKESSDLNEIKIYITDPYKSRAVKKLTVYTPVLERMQNVVIYDLPGFDSPTFIHSKFTIEKIKQADAVVFVRVANNPSLRQKEVDIITKTREEDGIELREKLFFFMNMADKIETVKFYNDCVRDFRKELERYKLTVPDTRVFFGSAMAYLQEIGEDADTYAIEGLKKLGLRSNIRELMEEIRRYYETERMKHLERRVSNVMGAIEELVDRLRIEFSDLSETTADRELFKKINIRRSEIKGKIKDEIQKYQRDLKQIQSERIISRTLQESINTAFTPEKLLSYEEIQSVKHDVEVKSQTTEERPESFNIELRKRLYQRINAKFEEIIRSNIEVSLNKIENDISGIFIKAIMNSSQIGEQKRTSEVEKIIKDKYFKDGNDGLGIDFSYHKFKIDIIAERFAGDIIQLLILNRVGSKDRENKIKEIEKEIYSILAYSSDFDPSLPLFNHPLLVQIKYHVNVSRDIREEIEKLLVTCSDILAGGKLEILQLLLRANNVKDILSEIEKRISSSTGKGLTIDTIRNIIESRIDDRYEYRIATNYDEVIEEIKRDIELVRHILHDTIISAIDPEKAIINRVTRYVNIILEDLDREDGKFNNLFVENLEIFLPDLISDTVKKKTKLKKIEKIKEALDELESQLVAIK